MTHDCQQFAARWHAFLDARGPAGGLDPGGCPDCARLVALADLFAGPLPAVVPQPDFAACAVAAVLSDKRRRSRLRGALAGVLAAAVAVVIAARPVDEPKLIAQAFPPVVVDPVIPVPPESPQRVGDVMAGAGASLVALTRRAADAAPSAPELSSQMAAKPASGPPELGHVPAAARAGFEPLTETTRRAATLFLRDAGLAPKVKS